MNRKRIKETDALLMNLGQEYLEYLDYYKKQNNFKLDMQNAEFKILSVVTMLPLNSNEIEEIITGDYTPLIARIQVIEKIEEQFLMPLKKRNNDISLDQISSITSHLFFDGKSNFYNDMNYKSETLRIMMAFVISVLVKREHFIQGLELAEKLIMEAKIHPTALYNINSESFHQHNELATALRSHINH